MTETRIPIEFEGIDFINFDLAEYDSWVGLAEREVVIDYHRLIIPYSTNYTFIRALGNQRVIIVNPRTKPKRPNAAIIGLNSVPIEFFADDAVQDVIATDDFIVFTYFDQAHSSREMGGQGAAVFDKSGAYLFGVRDTFGLDILDCHCAAAARPNRVALFTYPTFKLDLIDLKSKQHESFSVPKSLHPAVSLCEFNGDYIFSILEAEATTLYRWRPGDTEGEKIDIVPGFVRSMRGGRFLQKTGKDILIYEIA